jgi:hypothetical protein
MALSSISMMPIYGRVLSALMKRSQVLPFLALVTSLAAGPAGAATLSGGGGFDYQTGPHTQSYRSGLLFASAEGTPGDLTLAGIRYEDSRLGWGTGLFANAGVTMAPHVAARATVLRAIGNDAYRAWRWRVGPEVRLASDRTLGVYYLRLTNNAGESFGSGGVEFGAPLSPTVTAQVGSSYGRWNTDATTAQATVSGTWHPLGHVLFLGEVDLGRNLATTSTTGPSGGGGALGGLPLPGGLGGGGHGRGASETSTQSDFAAAGQIGIRVSIR